MLSKIKIFQLSLLVFIPIYFLQSLTLQNNQLEIITCIKDSYKYCSLGESVSGIGDVNQDGYDDVIIGNPSKNNYYIGEALIVYGGENMDSIPDIILHGENEHDAFGNIVTSVGDVNGDGYEDFAVSATGYGAPLEYGKGRVYIYFGGAAFDTIPDLVLTGENRYDKFGGGLTKRLCSGDVNADGYDDILISAPYYSLYRGKVYLYYGGDDIDSIPDWTVTGYRELLRIGEEISLGDVNGDKYDDILIKSCPGASPDSVIFDIYFGGKVIDTMKDYSIEFYKPNSLSYKTHLSQYMNDDKYGDFTLKKKSMNIYYGGEEPDTIPDLELKHWPLQALFKLYNAGDINGDGYQDIIARAGAAFSSSAGIYLGGNPMNGEPDWIGSIYEGVTSVNGAGDVNGDGYDDILIGGIVNWGQDRDWGKVYILAGNPNLVDIGTGIDDSETDNIVQNFKLYQNYPNPFNASTTIRYEVKLKSFIEVKVYNLKGKEVRTLVNKIQDAGEHEVKWDGKNNNGKEVSSGIYFIQLNQKECYRMIKMALIR
jgi:hypothetical protein